MYGSGRRDSTTPMVLPTVIGDRIRVFFKTMQHTSHYNSRDRKCSHSLKVSSFQHRSMCGNHLSGIETESVDIHTCARTGIF